jgi:hypothetical protein
VQEDTVTPEQEQALADALGKLPKKGGTEPHIKGWSVAANLHEWAMAHGFLSGAVFTLTKTRKGHSKTKAKLFLIGPCPWHPGHQRYYHAPLDPGLWFSK